MCPTVDLSQNDDILELGVVYSAATSNKMKCGIYAFNMYFRYSEFFVSNSESYVIGCFLILHV